MGDWCYYSRTNKSSRVTLPTRALFYCRIAKNSAVGHYKFSLGLDLPLQQANEQTQPAKSLTRPIPARLRLPPPKAAPVPISPGGCCHHTPIASPRYRSRLSPKRSERFLVQVLTDDVSRAIQFPAAASVLLNRVRRSARLRKASRPLPISPTWISRSLSAKHLLLWPQWPSPMPSPSRTTSESWPFFAATSVVLVRKKKL